MPGYSTQATCQFVVGVLRLRESADASRIEIRDVHARAAVRQPFGNRLANALGGARYERDASIVADDVSISS
jgi:hypothetical protein